MDIFFCALLLSLAVEVCADVLVEVDSFDAHPNKAALHAISRHKFDSFLINIVDSFMEKYLNPDVPRPGLDGLHCH
ncbi:MAG TPA: hypothetical protein PKC80_09610 [Burkholderiaceae bacterium]|nr:hypothetical protein [Burkholderiaceae bacterium]